MFKIKQNTLQFCPFYVLDGINNFLHSDGSIFDTPEYFPTKEDAQKVLDKFQPEHKWEHGDVFKTSDGFLMLYIHSTHCEPQVIYLIAIMAATCKPDAYLIDAEFLYNIKEKL